MGQNVILADTKHGWEYQSLLWTREIWEKKKAPLFRERNLGKKEQVFYDPGPNDPAFSATSKASFKF